MSSRPAAERRSAYPHFCAITTRWMDNDVYQHVNNVVYYSFFDTAVNEYLIEREALRIDSSEVVGLVVETQCRYFSPIAFPDRLQVGVRVGHVGNSSVRYELAIFREDEDAASAQGHFVHVYVDRESNRPVPLPAELRRVVESLRVADASA